MYLELITEDVRAQVKNVLFLVISDNIRVSGELHVYKCQVTCSCDLAPSTNVLTTYMYVRTCVPALQRNAAFTPDKCSRLYKYPGRAACIRIQVDTCRRDDNFVADTGYNVDGDNEYKWIQWIQLVSMPLFRATCIRCKRGITHA